MLTYVPGYVRYSNITSHFFDSNGFFQPVEKKGTNVVFHGLLPGTHFFDLKAFF